MIVSAAVLFSTRSPAKLAANRTHSTGLMPLMSSAYAVSNSLATSWVSTWLSPSKVVNTSVSARSAINRFSAR